MFRTFPKIAGRFDRSWLTKVLVLLLISAQVSCALYSARPVFAFTAVKGTVTAKSANVRKEASTRSQVVFCVKKGDSVVIIDEVSGDDQKSWSLIQVGKSVGYIRSDLVQKSKTVVNTKDIVSAGSSSQAVSDATNSPQTATNANAPKKGIIKGSQIRVRSKASVSSQSLCMLDNGAEVSVLSYVKGTDRNWYQVAFTYMNKPINGYIASSYVNVILDETNDGQTTDGQTQGTQSSQPEASNAPDIHRDTKQNGTTKGSSVNVRREPVSGAIICSVNAGTNCTVVDQTEGSDGITWYKISFIKGKTPQTGYIRSDFVDGVYDAIKLEKEALARKEQEEAALREKAAAEEAARNAAAATASTNEKTISSASIKGSGVRVRDRAVDGNIQAQLSTGHPLSILGENTEKDNYKWYCVKFSYLGSEKVGYVRSDLVNVVYSSAASDYATDPDFENAIAQFPDSYKNSLRALHSTYPNWRFEAVDTGLDFNEALMAESAVGKNLVSKYSISSWKSTQPQAYNWSDNTWYTFDGGSWASASSELIAFYMDPRNFLTDSGIFQFETLELRDYMNEAGVQNLLNGTFMSGSYTDTDGSVRSYASAFMEIGAMLGVSPYHLAARCIQEQGITGKSNSISGTVPGYENMFNYFNIGAYAYGGLDAVARGVLYAAGSDESYLRPWNSRYRSLFGGSKYVAEKYVQAGQNTLYFQKFNVVNKKNGIYSHQYMSNLSGASSESARLKTAYTDPSQTIVFRIPVYRNMPVLPCPKPVSDSNPNTYLSNLWVDGYSFTTPFTSGCENYTLTVDPNTESVNIGAQAVVETSSIGGTGTVMLNPGSNRFQICCKAQNGNTKNYIITINR